MSRTGFRALQEHEETSSEGTFRNARNTVAGTLKLLDPRMVKRRPLDFIAFAIGHVEGREFATHQELRAQLAAWGLPGCRARSAGARPRRRAGVPRRRRTAPRRAAGPL